MRSPGASQDGSDLPCRCIRFGSLTFPKPCRWPRRACPSAVPPKVRSHPGTRPYRWHGGRKIRWSGWRNFVLSSYRRCDVDWADIGELAARMALVRRKHRQRVISSGTRKAAVDRAVWIEFMGCGSSGLVWQVLESACIVCSLGFNLREKVKT